MPEDKPLWTIEHDFSKAGYRKNLIINDKKTLGKWKHLEPEKESIEDSD